jgi:hypothetical protein
MSGKRNSSLCRFTFADGRRCRSIPHPSFDGLCFQHGTFRPGESRRNNFLREIAPLAQAAAKPSDLSHAHRALARALQEGLISSEKLLVLEYNGSLARLSGRYSHEDSFTSAGGPAWDEIRQLLDGDYSNANPNSFISNTSPQASTKPPRFKYLLN